MSDHPHEETTIDKAAGFALLAGVAAVGVVAGKPFIGKFKGLLASGGAKVLGSLGLQGVDEAAGAARAIRGNVDHVIGNLLHDSSLALSGGLEGISSRIISDEVAPLRARTFIDTIRSHSNFISTAENEAALDLATPRIIARVHSALRSTTREGAEARLLDAAFLDDFPKITQGVMFQAADMTTKKKMVREALEASYKHTTSRKLITEVMADDENKLTVLRAVRGAAAERRGKEKFFDKFLNLGEDFKEITLRDVYDNEGKLNDVGHAIDRHVREQFALKDDESFFERIQERFQSGLKSVFGDADESLSNTTPHVRAVLDEFHQEFMGQPLGLFYSQRTSQLVSKAQLSRVAASRTKQILDEVQVPLFPGFFNVRISRLFGFMREDSRLVRDLGKVMAQGELRRSGMAIDPYTEAFGVGSKVISLDPETKKLTMLEESFRMLPKRMSRTIEETARNRVRMVQSVGENLQDLVHDHPNIKSTVAAALKGSEHDLSILRKIIYQHGDKLFHIGPPEEMIDVGVDGVKKVVSHPDQVALVPKQSALLLGIDHLALNKAFGDAKNVPISELNPKLLQQLMAEDYSASVHVTTEAAGKLLESASTARQNIGQFLASAAKDLRGRDLTIDGNTFLDDRLLDLMESSESPHSLWDTMYKHGLFTKEAADWLQGSPELFRAVEHARDVREDFIRLTPGEGGMMQQMKNAFFGEGEQGKLALDVHAALLKEVQSAYGILSLKEAGMTVETASQALRAIRTDDITAAQANPLMQRLSQALGLSLEDDPFQSTKYIFENVLKGVTPKGDNKLEFNLASLKRMAGFLDNFDVLRETEGYDAHIGSKILHTMYQDIKIIQNMHLSNAGLTQRIAGRMRQLTQYQEVADALTSRFTATRWWQPEVRDLTEAAASNYYLIPRSPALQLNQNLEGLLGDLGGRVRNTVGSLMDPHAARGPMGYLMTVLGQMPGRLGAEIGLGLNDFDKVTLLRSAGSFAAKRVLPLVVGYELYKNINADADNLGLPGLDDLGANLLANVNRTGATIKDALGLTGVFQSVVYSVPGLDQYFHPRSEQEYEDYLAYGDEAVRKGRGWLIGSRSAFTGGEVDYFRPNFYRRWKSGWTSASNVDLANPNYSFLPTLTNPLAPLNRLMDPGWWVRKHLRDRPYRENGIKPIEPVRSSNYIYIDSNGGPGATVGQFGRSLPPTMYGGESVFEKLGLVIGGQGGGEMSGPGGGFGQGFGPGGEDPRKLHVRLEKPVGGRQLRIDGFYDHFSEVAERYRQQAGLYGAILNALPFWPGDSPGIETQEVDQAIGWSRMFYMGNYGEALGPVSEFYRRFIPGPDRDYNAFSPYNNNMPTWLPEKFRKGDPYTRVPGQGEMVLPGDAWERLHPWFRPLKVRGSMIGLDEQEIVEKLMNPEIGEENEYLEFGTYAHLHIQRQLRDAGMLIGAEVPIYDSEDNISGTMDAIIRGASGPEVLEIKTQNSRAFLKGETPDKYFDQLNFYLHTTGLKRGQLAFVNSEDPTQVRFVSLEYDPERYERMMEKITTARATITDLVEQGVVSPFETYDILARLEVLSNVAPNSTEFNELMSAATRSGGFGGQEKLIFEQIKDRAKLAKQRYNLYPHRDINTETHSLEVLAVNDDGTFTTEFGTFRLAGLEFDRQAFAYKDPDELLGEHGIVAGKRASITVQQGAMNPRITASTVQAAIVGRTNRDLIREGAANPTYDSRDPMDSLAIRGRTGGALEWASHSDFIIQNKFFRVRSGVEQFERGEVFGTDYASWQHPIQTMVLPTIYSLVAKDPLIAGIQGGFVASLFARSPEAKLKVGGVVGGLLLLASTARMVWDEADPNHPWTPKRYREQNEFDEYYDALEYVKQTAVAEAAKDKALIYEGVNVDLLNKAQKRVQSAIGPYSILAIEAEKKARRTMYAYDAVAGSLQDALAVIPERQRQIAEETILHGTLSEKHRLFTLLPRSQKRVLGSFLGESGANIPERPSLTAIFQSSFLPRPDWEGWSPLVDMADVETVAEKDEGLKIQQPSPDRLSQARSNTIGVRIPNRHHPTAMDVRRRLNEILAHGGLDDFELEVHVATASERAVNVNFQIGVDRTEDLRQQIKDQIRR